MQSDQRQADIEALLTREGRAVLPFGRQLMLYLDPFALFMDASRGPAWRRECALSFNCARRSMLLAYIRRWAVIAAGSFLGITSSEAMAAHTPVFIIPAAGFGIGCSVALTVTFCASAAYVLLALKTRQRGASRGR